jgi:membrane peptidoglycan carboxypeptidase
MPERLQPERRDAGRHARGLQSLIIDARNAPAAHYFGKAPANLTLRESLFLAALLPSPLKLHALKGNLPDAYLQSFDHLIDLATQNHLVTDADAQQARTEPIVFR